MVYLVAEWSFLTPEDPGSNSIKVNFSSIHLLLIVKKRWKLIKWGREWHIFKLRESQYDVRKENADTLTAIFQFAFKEVFCIKFREKIFFAKNVFFKMEPPASFAFIFIFSNKHYHFYSKYIWKLSIQYRVLGFKPTIFRTWVSSYND